MECAICKEKDASKLALRTSVINQKIVTIQICTSCLWERMTSEETNDENILPKQVPIEGGISEESESTYSGMG